MRTILQRLRSAIARKPGTSSVLLELSRREAIHLLRTLQNRERAANSPELERLRGALEQIAEATGPLRCCGRFDHCCGLRVPGPADAEALAQRAFEALNPSSVEPCPPRSRL